MSAPATASDLTPCACPLALLTLVPHPPPTLSTPNPHLVTPQTLYERACDYLELDRRVEVLNARFTVLQGMLDMMRDHITTSHRCATRCLSR